MTLKLTRCEFRDDDRAKKLAVRYVALAPLDQQKILING
jgi:hypothetical protein